MCSYDLNVSGKVIHPKYEYFISEYIKGKAVPLQAWTGPEISRSLRLPDFNTIGT